MADKRQAIILIHGIGEQHPMQNLRAFVEAAWARNPGAKHDFAKAGSWSHPDDVSGGFELRRIATSRNKDDVLSDFYEFYWAHMMSGNELGHVWDWARTLLRRNPFGLSPTLRLAWFVLVIAGIVGLALAINSAMGGSGFLPIPSWVSLILTVAVWPALSGILRTFVGDAARYLRPAPGNIDVRHRIREAGVKLLDALHERGYDRIVIVGHSLGSVIGYDMLRHGWARRYQRYGVDPKLQEEAAAELERLAYAEPFDAAAYRAAQARYGESLNAAGLAWKVTDFVTLGSPLTHADVLLAADAAELTLRQAERELPTCPPAREIRGERPASFRYRKRFPPLPGRKNGRWHDVPHHAALFAPVRWTNLYFPTHGLLWGDPVGGPVAPLFGGGVRDVAVETGRNGGRLSHTEYWNAESDTVPGSHVEALWAALDL